MRPVEEQSAFLGIIRMGNPHHGQRYVNQPCWTS
jgi:hypothetical protein